MFNYLKANTILPNGARVLVHRVNRWNRAYVLCAIENPFHPFVVWRLDPATGTCTSGDYFSDLEESVTALQMRAGK